MFFSSSLRPQRPVCALHTSSTPTCMPTTTLAALSLPAGWGRLIDTLRTKLLSLPAELEIYPGHQAGSACGAGLSGKAASTIGFEKRCNPMLSMSREAFVDALTADIPPQPADMARIVEANLRGVAPEFGHA